MRLNIKIPKRKSRTVWDEREADLSYVFSFYFTKSDVYSMSYSVLNLTTNKLLYTV